MLFQLSTIFLINNVYFPNSHHFRCEVIMLSLWIILAGYNYWPVYSLVNRVGDLEFRDKEASNSRSLENIRIPNQSENGGPPFSSYCLKASFEETNHFSHATRFYHPYVAFEGWKPWNSQHPIPQAGAKPALLQMSQRSGGLLHQAPKIFGDEAYSGEKGEDRKPVTEIGRLPGHLFVR